MKISRISKDDLVANQWDGGKTYEYYIYPPESKYTERNFKFRISSASLEKIPSNFTRFENYQRYLVMLDNTLNITRNGVDETYCQNQIFEFDSNDKIVSSSLGNDFNLMFNNRFVDSNIYIPDKDLSTNCNFVIGYAIKKSSIKIDNQLFDVLAGDVLVVENFENSLINIHTSSEIILSEIRLK